MLSLAISNLLQAEKVLVIPIRQEISPVVTRLVSKGLEKANRENYDLVIIDMNTYGGLLADADSIRSALLNFNKPIWVFINKNAASAGALISIACDKIYMQRGGTIGAATVVNQDGEVAPDKYQSYMRGLMRATAEANGKDSFHVFKRNPLIAEAMVDEDIDIPGISKKGEIVTFTTSEAIKFNYCEGEVNSINEILKLNLVESPTIDYIQETTMDKLIGWLLNPAVRSILIAGIIFGLYFEMQTPGLGFPSAAAVLAALLYFAPAYLEGLAENWEIILFVLGLILIALELLVIPGFGVAGVLGIIFSFSGLMLAMVRNVQLDFSLVGYESIFLSIAILIGIFVLFATFLIFRSRTTHMNSLFEKLVHSETLAGATVGNLALTLRDALHQEVEVINECKPEGKVIFENQIYPASSIGSVLERGDKAIVVAIRENKLIVKAKVKP